MSTYLETANNQIISDVANSAVDYLLGLYGYFPDWGELQGGEISPFWLESAGNNLTIHKGIGIIDGKRFSVTSPEILVLLSEPSGTKAYDIVGTVNMGTKAFTIEIVNQPSVLNVNNIWSNEISGITMFKLGTLVNGTTGIVSTNLVLPLLPKIDLYDIITNVDDINLALDEKVDKAGDTMTGALTIKEKLKLWLTSATGTPIFQEIHDNVGNLLFTLKVNLAKAMPFISSAKYGDVNLIKTVPFYEGAGIGFGSIINENTGCLYDINEFDSLNVTLSSFAPFNTGKRANTGDFEAGASSIDINNTQYELVVRISSAGQVLYAGGAQTILGGGHSGIVSLAVTKVEGVFK